MCWHAPSLRWYPLAPIPSAPHSKSHLFTAHVSPGTIAHPETCQPPEDRQPLFSSPAEHAERAARFHLSHHLFHSSSTCRQVTGFLFFQVQFKTTPHFTTAVHLSQTISQHFITSFPSSVRAGSISLQSVRLKQTRH